MKYLNLKNNNLLIITILFFSFKGNSQTLQTSDSDIMGTIITTGNDAVGSSGVVAYSIGQVFYTYIGNATVYNVAQGVQQQESGQNLSKPKIIETKTEVLIYPNPTVDFVNVNIKGFELENGQRSYELYDLQGRVLRRNEINQAETQISLSNLSPSVYILRLYVDGNILGTFKIVKK